MSPPPRSGPRRLGRAFFRRPTLEVARDLVGRRLVRVRRGRRLSGRIVEVEAYIGPTDTACHARSGPTRRNRSLFAGPGVAYVYFTYGMHHLLNLVTEEEGFPAAVLVRAVDPEEGLSTMRRLRGPVRPAGRTPPNWLTGGPARLCQALDVDLGLDGADVVRGASLRLEEGAPQPGQVRATPRIGIDYAAPRDRRAPWRFVLEGSPFLSRRQ